MPRSLVGLAALACGCALAAAPSEQGSALEIRAVNPGTIVPGSLIAVEGGPFADEELGTSHLRLVGFVGDEEVDVTLPLRFVDAGRAEALWPGGPAPGRFLAKAILEVESAIDGDIRRSAPLIVTLEVRDQLEPRLDELATGVIFVNDPILVAGDGFLLGGAEGNSVALVTGCFRQSGAAACEAVVERAVPLVPVLAHDRTRASFAFAPAIAGIHPGSFEGEVRLENRHASGVMLSSAFAGASYEVVPPRVFRLAPEAASLGQLVEIQGGGFVGGAPDPAELFTTIRFSGTFAPAAGATRPLELELVPEFVSGPLVRYVLAEDDELGARIDLRREAGILSGTAQPVIRAGSEVVAGEETPVSLAIAPIKQVVWLRFLPSYLNTLGRFGLLAVDESIRERVHAVARRDYAGVNLELRTERPADFVLFSTVDVAGPDPNGLGLFGYDNSPGKDTGNERLWDRIGGVNAETQEDGHPGYGGVFVESFFLYEEDARFAEIFDRFRPDRGGTPVSAFDHRSTAIAEAVGVLGSLIGTTLTHELGHSLGLANPFGASFHNPGDEPDRLMDSGDARPFEERAELGAAGPARFCDEEYAYLRQILPAAQPAPAVTRPRCRY